jgi:hypothetical protein
MPVAKTARATVKTAKAGGTATRRKAGELRYQAEFKRLRASANKRVDAIRASRLIRDTDLQVMINTRD